MMRSSDVAVEDVTLASSLRSRPIRWISFTFVRLLDFEFEQGHHYPTFQAFFVQDPLLHLFFFFFFFIVLLTSCVTS